MLRIGYVRRVPLLSSRARPRFQSTSTESEEPPREKLLYNRKEVRDQQAILSNPVNKPYHLNKKLVMQARARREQMEKELPKSSDMAANSDSTEVQEVKTQKTALQLAQEELERENQLKYYEVHEYKPKWYEFGGLLTNLDVDYATEVKRHKKWRKRLDRAHWISIIFLFCFTVFLVGELLIKIYGSHFVRRVELGRLQAMENKIARLELQLNVGKNWEPDFKKKQRDLLEAREALAVLQAEEAAKAAETLPESSSD